MKLSDDITIPDGCIEFHPIRSRGPGGQNVNKVSSGVHIRFDIRASELEAHIVEKLLSLNDKRITRDGIVVIKAISFRSAEKNRQDGVERLAALIKSVNRSVKPRKPTRPTRASVARRLESKARRANTKALRKKII